MCCAKSSEIRKTVKQCPVSTVLCLTTVLLWQSGIGPKSSILSKNRRFLYHTHFGQCKMSQFHTDFEIPVDQAPPRIFFRNSEDSSDLPDLCDHTPGIWGGGLKNFEFFSFRDLCPKGQGNRNQVRFRSFRIGFRIATRGGLKGRSN